MLSKKVLAFGALTMATLFWGGNFLVGKIISNDISPISLSYLRWAPASLLLLIISFKSIIRQWQLIQTSWKKIVLLSLFGVVIFPTTLYQALQLTQVLNASIYLSITPIVVIILNRIIFKDVIEKKVILGAILSFLAVVIVLFRGGNLKEFEILSFNLGDIYAILATLSWASYCSLLQIKPPELSTQSFLGVSVFIGVIILSPFFIYELVYYGHQFLLELPVYTWWAIAYLVVFPSILSYWLWNLGSDILGTTYSSLFTNAIPLFSALLAILVLGESIHYYHLISFVLIGLALFLSKK